MAKASFCVNDYGFRSGRIHTLYQTIDTVQLVIQHSEEESSKRIFSTRQSDVREKAKWEIEVTMVRVERDINREIENCDWVS